ncbi:MAG TPA: hypothetical protein VFR33_11030 [Candidatus Dormibacteraeota bacterium]|nr:hypothetical protein [Candidatus Dormibacteraeota bacterium]
MNAPKNAELTDWASIRADSRRRLNSVIRAAVFVYFAAGMALLVSDGMVSALRYQADKRFPAAFLLVVFVCIIGLLGLANWDTFRRPINAKKWIILCVLSSVGIIELLFAPTQYGGSGA